MRLIVGGMAEVAAVDVGWGVESGEGEVGGDGWNISTSGQKDSSPSCPSKTSSLLRHLWPR